MVHIPGFTHPVEQYWLEETLLQIGYQGGGKGNKGGSKKHKGTPSDTEKVQNLFLAS